MTSTVAPSHAAHRAEPSAGPGRRRSVAVAIALGVAVAAAAGLGGVAASSASATYDALELPAYAPPSWLFGPVWTVLYVAMAVAAWLVWRRVGADRALLAWGVQLVFNAAWTPLFFAADAYALALVEIVVLLAAVVVVTTVLFARRRAVAAWLMVPYVAWVAFATALNAGIVVLN